MSKPTIIPRDPALLPVAKNGEFLGYATQAQIDASDGVLTLYFAAPQVAESAPKEPEPAKEPEGTAGAKPEAVRKGPATPAKDA